MKAALLSATRLAHRIDDAPAAWVSKRGRRVKVPPLSDRKQARRVIQDALGIDISDRTMERWPVPTKLVNGRAVGATAAFLDYAQQLIENAPVTIPGNATYG
jgi:hypothetical protein